ncbi:hypothetical protein PVIIG_06063 [Plasmodium vivax India VII]|uniref:Uncharacterized protein n=1 Tax=Plasmodium vivax India VII TaxID=1077284 RepID=A0A0J9S3B0_PLAVI|nr:hypothetical protein PVIIG_06063 [Plasmodium vivax India VII]
MKFWIYEHLMNITTDKNEVNSFYKPLESIRKLNSAKWNKCNIEFYVNNNDFKIFKNTYDFLYTSSDIIDKISKTYDTEVELYCKHIKEFFRYYNSIKGSCTVSNQGICYNILEKFKTFFTYEGQLDNIYKNCKYEKTTCPSDSVVEEIPCLKDKEHESIHSKQIDYTHNVINIISRFWLRSRMRKKNNIHKNISEGEYDILENTSRTEKFYPESKEYNLKYQ